MDTYMDIRKSYGFGGFTFTLLVGRDTAQADRFCDWATFLGATVEREGVACMSTHQKEV